MFWYQEFPNLIGWLAKIGINLGGKLKVKANQELESWCWKLCNACGEALAALPVGQKFAPGDLPVVYQQLETTIANDNKSPSLEATLITTSRSPQQLEIASELLDHLGITWFFSDLFPLKR